MPRNTQREGRSSQEGHWENWSEPYEGLGGRGWHEGLTDAMHRDQGPHVGRGPRKYKRPDHRIEEDINERLTLHGMIDATHVEVVVQNGEVVLRGHVDSRAAQLVAEDIAETVFGVKEVNNQIRVRQKMPLQRKAG
jgi:hypothetical protein